ncbi:MAG: TonB-dependent receptor [Lacunisphaera sp.]|nr:TonB-dependent receptor [Lacunisphaera sp.]
MNSTRTPRNRGLTRLLALSLTVSAATAAFAQTSLPAGQNDEAMKLEKFVVTGSYIPMAADAIAQPVSVVTNDDIVRTGITTNALEVLKKAIPQFQGNTNIGSNNANTGSGSTGGGSQASLRNLTTLSLINGRRAAASPITGTGGNQFVDLNIIPLAAIDSIEVLLDGASATYGSDATSGVINIKSKSDYSGSAVGGHYEFSDQPGKTARFGGNFVTGASSGKTNITIAGGWAHEDPMYQFERGYSNPQYGTASYGGVINFGANYFVLNPAYPAPPVGAVKPTITFVSPTTATSALAAIPTAPDGKAYFGPVGSTAVYWGKATTAGAGVIGFGSGELGSGTSAEAAQVAFNLANYVTILQERDSMGAMVTFDHKISDQVEFFGDLLASQIKTKSQINAQPIGAVSTFNVNGTLPDNPFANTLRVRNRFVNNPRVYEYDTMFMRLVAGFRGKINDRLTFETAVNLNTSDLAYRNPGVIDSAKLLAAAGISPLGDGAINIFQASIPPAAVAAANFVGTGYNNFTSGLRSWDGRLVYKAFALDSGDVTVVLGSEVRRDTLEGTADLNSVPDEYGNIGWTGATSVNPFKATRDVQAGFIEALIPLAAPKQNLGWAHTFDLDVAARYEKYSDTDDPLVPKITFRWLPFNDEFAIRGTWGKSFNAPTLYQLVGPSDVGFTPEVNLLPHGATDAPGNYVIGQAQIRGGNNPSLKPAHSKALTFGVVWSPKALKGFSAELTYWDIKEKDIVGVIASQDILQDLEDNGAASPYLAQNAGPNNTVGNFINPLNGKSVYDARIDGFRADGAPITAAGQVAGNIDAIYLERPLVNIASQSASGIDFTTRYKWEVGSLGLIDVSANVAYWLGYEFSGEELGGRATVTGGTIPRYTAYVQGAWKRGNWDVFTSARYIPKVKAPDEQSGKTAAEQYATFDLGVGYRFEHSRLKILNGLHVSLVVKNLGNEMPPQLPDTFPNDSVDTGAYDPVGRTFLISAEYKF